MLVPVVISLIHLIFFLFQTLASSAVTGIIVGLLSAWPILVLTTLNFIIGTIAAVTIGLVTACVVGLIPLAGWKLGVNFYKCPKNYIMENLI